jgi:hypothetical protein
MSKQRYPSSGSVLFAITYSRGRIVGVESISAQVCVLSEHLISGVERTGSWISFCRYCRQVLFRDYRDRQDILHSEVDLSSFVNEPTGGGQGNYALFNCV